MGKKAVSLLMLAGGAYVFYLVIKWWLLPIATVALVMFGLWKWRGGKSKK